MAVQQAYQMCALGGHLITTSLVSWKYLDTRHAVHDWRRDTIPDRQAAPADARRPGSVRLLEQGQYDAKSLATRVAPLERMLEAYAKVAYAPITAIMTT